MFILIGYWWSSKCFSYFSSKKDLIGAQILKFQVYRIFIFHPLLMLFFFELIESYQQYVNIFPLSLTVLSVSRYLWMKRLWDTNKCAWFCNILYKNAKICIMLNVNEDRTDVSNFRFLKLFLRIGNLWICLSVK